MISITSSFTRATIASWGQEPGLPRCPWTRCSLWRIILPLAAPALAVVFLFNFMSSWNDFLLARIMLQKPEMYTWPLGLQSLQTQFATEWGAYAAAALMLAVPVSALFLYTS